MITRNSGKSKIPENKRFVGFAGDNLHKTIQFYITPAEPDCTYNSIFPFAGMAFADGEESGDV